MYESADGEKERKMAEYIFKVLDALGVKEGPSHAEVMWLEEGNVCVCVCVYVHVCIYISPCWEKLEKQVTQ